MKSVIEVYSDMAKKNPPWKADEEAQFIQSCCTRTGKWKSKAMKDRFVAEAVKHNLSLVFKMVNRYAFNKENEDLVQRAVIAMAEALKKYDPASRNKISTWIHQPIVWSIKQAQNTYYRGHAIHEQIAALNHRYKLNMSVISVDATPGGSEEGDSIGNFISSENVDSDYVALRGFKTMDDECRDVEIKSGVEGLMTYLPKILNKKEVRVIKYLLKGLSMADISVKLKVTRMRISQISAKAFEKIRNSRVGKKLKGLLS